MPSMRSALIVVALVACGSKKPPQQTQTQQTQTPNPRQKGALKPGATAPSGPPPACPATFGTATGGCTVEQECDYPEGTCRCEEPGHCSGANLPRPAEPLEWSCERPPPNVRPDGCPGTEPHGDACKTDGKECTYGACCVSVLTCEDGHWQQKKPTECPP
jgi:hypothetical protein